MPPSSRHRQNKAGNAISKPTSRNTPQVGVQEFEGEHKRYFFSWASYLAQAKLAAHAAEQIARSPIDPIRGRRRLPIGVALDDRDRVARIFRRVAVRGVRVQGAENLERGERAKARLVEV